MPDHEFSYKVNFTPKRGIFWSASLIIKPYVFTIHTSKGNKVRWNCLKCRRDQDSSTFAWTEMKMGPDDKPSYELKSVDANHVCNPSPTYYLDRLFRNKLSIVISEDLLQSIPEAYETVKNEMCQTMDPVLQKIFLQNLPPVKSITSNFSKFRKSLSERRISSDNFVCEICSYETCDLALMRRHRHDKHQDEIEKSHKCDTCGKTFLLQESLMVHLKNVHKIHSEHFDSVKSFACDQCDLVFLSKIRLKQHFNSVHLKLTPFECDICQKSFRSKAHVNRHQKTVHKKYPEESLYI